MGDVEVVQFNRDTYLLQEGKHATYEDYLEYLRRLNLLGKQEEAVFDIRKTDDGRIVLDGVNPMYQYCLGTLIIPQFITDIGSSIGFAYDGTPIIYKSILADFNFQKVVVNNSPNRSIKLDGLCASLLQGGKFTLEIRHPEKVVSAIGLFAGSTEVEEIDMRDLDFSRISSQVAMFYQCIGLSKLLYSNLEDLHSTDMSYMFWQCSSLRDINNIFKKLDFQRCVNAIETFRDCSLLTVIDLQLKDFRSLKDASGMFEGTRIGGACWDDKSIQDICGNADTIYFTQLEKAPEMFQDCPILQSIDLTRFYMPQVQRLDSFIKGCLSLKSLKIDSDRLPEVRSLNGFASDCQMLGDVEILGKGFKNAKILRAMFNRCSQLKTVDFRNLDLQSVDDMAYMFCFCKSLGCIDLCNVKVSRFTTLQSMFYYCDSLRQVKLPSIEFTAEDIKDLFMYSSSLREVDLGGLDIDNCKSVLKAFKGTTRLKVIHTKYLDINEEKRKLMMIPENVKICK